MRRKLLLAFGLAALCLPVGAVYAAPNPSGTGMPNQTCQDINPPGTNSGATGPFYPGHAQSAPGSVFAEPGGVFPNGGKGGQQYNLVGAPSQYDVAPNTAGKRRAMAAARGLTCRILQLQSTGPHAWT